MSTQVHEEHACPTAPIHKPLKFTGLTLENYPRAPLPTVDASADGHRWKSKMANKGLEKVSVMSFLGRKGKVRQRE